MQFFLKLDLPPVPSPFQTSSVGETEFSVSSLTSQKAFKIFPILREPVIQDKICLPSKKNTNISHLLQWAYSFVRHLFLSKLIQCPSGAQACWPHSPQEACINVSGSHFQQVLFSAALFVLGRKSGQNLGAGINCSTTHSSSFHPSVTFLHFWSLNNSNHFLFSSERSPLVFSFLLSLILLIKPTHWLVKGGFCQYSWINKIHFEVLNSLPNHPSQNETRNEEINGLMCSNQDLKKSISKFLPKLSTGISSCTS